MSVTASVEVRALMSAGTSDALRLYELVREYVSRHHIGGGILVDAGCGQGMLYRFLADRFERYIGIDVVNYGQYQDAPGAEFHKADLSCERTALPDNSADFVCCLETIEHVENPRALMRELVRLAKPGGGIIVTTPNQLSLMSKLGLVIKNQFVHFQEGPGLYPSHLSALLEIDLIRMARENKLSDIDIAYTGDGRIPLSSKHWPRWMVSRQGRRGRAFSDNILLFGRKSG